MRKTWEGAPEWANWKAMDDDGQEWYFEEKPQMVRIATGNCWVSVNGRKQQKKFNGSETLEKRPSAEQSFMQFHDAPSWVKFGAIDMEGRCYWLQYQPEFGSIDRSFGRSKIIFILPNKPEHEIIFKRP